LKTIKTIKTKSASLRISLRKSLGISKSISIKAAIFLGLLATATITPMFVHSQPITGSLVNAILFIATTFLGIETAIMIGLIPSVIALSFGLLPVILAPMVPFIMISNALLVIIFGLFQKRNYWLAVISASLIKFIFLFSTSSVVIGLLIKKEIAAKVAAMMSWPQLFTALSGGIIAWLIIKAARK
jgi:hypothetical protein